jgi:hypothetical protein
MPKRVALFGDLGSPGIVDQATTALPYGTARDFPLASF